MRLRYIIGAVLALFAAAVVLERYMQTLDGVGGLLCIWENTHYAAGYSDTAFQRIAVGMSEQEARAELGDPLNAIDFTASKTAPDRSLFFSYRVEAGPYRLRTLLLFHGRVTKAVAECTGD